MREKDRERPEDRERGHDQDRGYDPPETGSFGEDDDEKSISVMDTIEPPDPPQKK